MVFLPHKTSNMEFKSIQQILESSLDTHKGGLQKCIATIVQTILHSPKDVYTIKIDRLTGTKWVGHLLVNPVWYGEEIAEGMELLRIYTSTEKKLKLKDFKSGIVDVVGSVANEYYYGS